MIIPRRRRIDIDIDIVSFHYNIGWLMEMDDDSPQEMNGISPSGVHFILALRFSAHVRAKILQ